MKIDKSIILEHFPENKKFSINDIAYVYNKKPKDVRKEYKRSFNKIKKITKLYRTLESFEVENKKIIIKGNNNIREIIRIVNYLYKKFPLRYFTDYMTIDPRVILYIICTNDRASYLFKLPKEKVEFVKSNSSIQHI